MTIPEALRGKDLLEEALEALDHCFLELGYDEGQVRKLLPDALFDKWEERQERLENAGAEDDEDHED